MRKVLFRKPLVITLLVTLFLVSLVSLAAAASADTKELVIKIDRQDIAQLPRNFRMCSDPYKRMPKDGNVPSRLGLDKLRASASSSFSELEFEQILARIPTARKNVIVVDLRQESHGYLNGTAVSWFVDNNWGNDGKTLEQVKLIERSQLNMALADSPTTVYNFDDSKNVPTTSFKMVVNSARTEEEMVKQHGAGYFRLALSDHFRPEDKDVDEFIQFYKRLPKDAWLHFHCFAGEGRTTIFMNMYDILSNAKKVSFDEIVARQGLIGPVDLRNIPESKKNWKRKAYQERLQFVKHFYRYVKESPEILPVSYSEWAKQRDY